MSHDEKALHNIFCPMPIKYIFLAEYLRSPVTFAYIDGLTLVKFGDT